MQQLSDWQDRAHFYNNKPAFKTAIDFKTINRAIQKICCITCYSKIFNKNWPLKNKISQAFGKTIYPITVNGTIFKHQAVKALIFNTYIR